MKALLVEPNQYHYEVVPGFAHYFDQLGYDVDVLAIDHEAWGDEYSRCPQLKGRLQFHRYEEGALVDAVCDLVRRNHYDTVFFTSLNKFENKQNNSVHRKFEHVAPLFGQMVGCYHRTMECKMNGDVALAQQGRCVSLTPVHTPEFDLPEVNAHFFCDYVPTHRKNELVSIASIGISTDRDELFKAASRLRKAQGTRVRLSIVGRKHPLETLTHDLKCVRRYLQHFFAHREYDRSFYVLRKPMLVPLNLRRTTTVASNVPFEELFGVIEQSDFLVCNVAPHLFEEFACERTSGIRQLSLGFLTPCIIPRRLAAYYGFDDANAIVYDTGELQEALERAASMTPEAYDRMCHALDELHREVERRSLDNLRKTIGC